MFAAPLHSLLTSRLCLRGWHIEDVDVLSSIIARDIEHLKPWLPWAESEPLSRQARLHWVRQVQLAFELGSDLYFGIWSRKDGALLGGHGLHRTAPHGPYETGYWVATDRLRQGIAREATGAVTRYALMLKGVEELLIRIRPDNHPSARVAESLGFEGPFPRVTPSGDRCGAHQSILVYTMDKRLCRQQPWSREPLTVVDVLGRKREL